MGKDAPPPTHTHNTAMSFHPLLPRRELTSSRRAYCPQRGGAGEIGANFAAKATVRAKT